MANTGYERSLTLTVSMVISGNVVDGYPITYQGRNAFTHAAVSYPAITALQLRQMKDADYTVRLNAFKAYVESIEAGLNIDENTVVGGEPSKQNLTQCPI